MGIAGQGHTAQGSWPPVSPFAGAGLPGLPWPSWDPQLCPESIVQEEEEEGDMAGTGCQGSASGSTDRCLLTHPWDKCGCCGLASVRQGLFLVCASCFPLNSSSRKHLNPLGSDALQLTGFSTKAYFYFLSPVRHRL